MEKLVLRVLVLVLAGVAVGVFFYSRSRVVTQLPPQPEPVIVKGPTPAPAPPSGHTGPVSPTGAPTGPQLPVTPPAPTGQPPDPLKGYGITLDQAKALFDAHDAIFIDARPYTQYEAGHISGAMHLDKGHMLQKKIRDYLPGKEVVVYCHGVDCTDSEAVVIRLQALNLAIGPYRIIKDGYPGWESRNKADPRAYPIEKGGEVGFQ